MRVAVLADIHGNLPALDAVLDDVDAAGVDRIVLNGDLGEGPMPGETLDRLMSLGDRAVWVRGNGDRWLVEAYDGTLSLPGLATNPSTDWFAWCASRITRSQRDLLAALPLTVSLDVDGLGPVGFCHATARDDNEIVLVDSPLSLYASAFASIPEPTVLLGHTHMPFDRLADRRRFVNSGSVGLGYGHGGASWALLGPDVVLRRTVYDAAAAADVLRSAGRGLPGCDDVVDNVLAPESDRAAVEAFTETSRVQQEARAGGR